MSKESKLAVYRQKEQAAKWQRENRALWAESATGFVSLDSDPSEFADVFEIAECNPEYILMGEQELDLLDIMLVDEAVVAATASPVVSRFKNRSFN